jgi:hypothetical protein
MQLEQNKITGFIRRHCGSVANKVPSDRATGAQRQCFITVSSIHLQRGGTGFHLTHPAGEAIPSGLRLLRVFTI